MAPTYLPDIAYLVVLEADLLTRRDLPETAKVIIDLDLRAHAALFRTYAGIGVGRNGPWPTLEEVIDAARRTVADAFADGWLPTNVPPPF